MRHPTKHLRLFLTSLVAAGWLALTMSAALAQGPARDLTAQSANIYAGGGGSLSAASGAGMAATVADFLATKGHGAETLASLVLTATHVSPTSGVTHLKFGQTVAGLGVYGTYVKAAFDGDGNLIHLIENLAELSGRGVVSAAAAPRDALNEAMLRNHPGVIVGLVEGNRSGNVVSFSGGGFFHRDPTVTGVAIVMENGRIAAGFLVETWTNRGNMLHHTLVGGAGGVLGVELRTNNDSYKIFADHPNNSSQTVEAGPDAPGAPEFPGSPEGWLSLFENGNWIFPAQTTVNIGGNNAHAYLDADANNAPDAGGSEVTNGHFETSANLSLEPDDTLGGNKAVAVQNLFYFNNLIHDKLYRHGFIEGVGNFQENNFGNFGNGSDSVNAEAQDGSGTDNANFATPSDGSNPRMQMFLWTGDGDHLVVTAAGPIYYANGAQFGDPLDETDSIMGSVVIATPADGCVALTNGGAISGNIALIDRGTCTFVDKVQNAETAGAIGVIISNDDGDSLITMSSDGDSITKPSVFIGQGDGGAIREALLLGSVTATLRSGPSPQLMRDGDVDSDIIWHEYGHGLTWRMIGGMNGGMSGAIGEGMSDVLSILANNNDVVGEYSYSNPIGIRSAPYTNYGRHYGDMGGSSVHFDGEIYAATIWRLWELFQDQSPAILQDTLYDYLIGGMNYTPAGPAMEDMRNGILDAVDSLEINATTASEHKCLVWEAFAQFGIGDGAEGTTKGGSPFGPRLGTVTESFDLPPECSGGNAAPQVSAGADAIIDENGTFSGSGSFTDPDADTWVATVDYGESSGPQPLTLLGQTFSLSHVYASAASSPYTVTVTVDDGTDTGSDTVVVTVLTVGGNTAPQVSAGADVIIDEGGTFSGSGSFTDPDADTWVATVDYGESSGPQPLTLLGQTFSLSHVYASAASSPYTVTVTVDDGTDTGSDTVVVTVLTVGGGTGSIRGTVVDSSGSKVQGVFVETDTGQSATTNRGGKYNLKNVPAGTRTLMASKNSCSVEVVELNVISGNSLTVDVDMTCLP